MGRRALEFGVDYALNRKQFGKAIIAFPRVADKLAMGLVDMVLARELTYAAARTKDLGKRCDIEAGMACCLTRICFRAVMTLPHPNVPYANLLFRSNTAGPKPRDSLIAAPRTAIAAGLAPEARLLATRRAYAS